MNGTTTSERPSLEASAATAIPEGFKVFSEMTAEEQGDAVAAFEAAVETFADARGPTAPGAVQAARRLIPLHAHRLARGADGVVRLLVEFPVHHRNPNALPALDRRRWEPSVFTGVKMREGCSTYEEHHDSQFCDGEVRATALAAAIALLISSDNPEAELARRRAWLAAKKKAAADAAEAAKAADQERRREEARWARENASRIKAWEALSPDLKALHTVAAKMPEYRALLEALADVQTPRYGARTPSISMPDSFRPDLRGV